MLKSFDMEPCNATPKKRFVSEENNYKEEIELMFQAVKE